MNRAAWLPVVVVDGCCAGKLINTKQYFAFCHLSSPSQLAVITTAISVPGAIRHWWFGGKVYQWELINGSRWITQCLLVGIVTTANVMECMTITVKIIYVIFRLL